MRIGQTKIRVRYQETDAMGVVYYGQYFVWFEVARTEFLRDSGVSYRDLEKEGLRLMVVEASCRYKYPCRYDDLVSVHTWVSTIERTSLFFDYKVYVGEKIAALGRTAHVCTSPSLKPIKIPPKLREALTEQG